MSDGQIPAENLPRQPIDRIIKPLERFLRVEAASGVVLVICAAIALVLANSPFSDGYLAFWKTPIELSVGSFRMSHSLQHWINDGLMAVFFYVVGLEVKRELVVGELRDARRAALPLLAAIGGMVVPAGIYLALQLGEPGEDGWGIPMATDIAFVVGCMAILGRRVPPSLRILLLSLAIADDIGAILVIAIGYTESLNVPVLLADVALIGLVAVIARLGVRSFLVYGLLGFAVWLAAHESGIHATIAGVVLGLMTPARAYLSEGRFGDLLAAAQDVFRGGRWGSESGRAAQVLELQRAARETIPPVELLEGALHPWVSFVIMPLFALANAGVVIDPAYFTDSVAISVVCGLVLGKPLGVLLFSWLGVRSGLARLPDGVTWLVLAGGGALAGIGFTMALFIAGLALEPPLLDAAKVGVLVASALSAAIGMGLLYWKGGQS